MAFKLVISPRGQTFKGVSPNGSDIGARLDVNDLVRRSGRVWRPIARYLSSCDNGLRLARLVLERSRTS
jgi:hypothetical protein